MNINIFCLFRLDFVTFLPLSQDSMMTGSDVGEREDCISNGLWVRSQHCCTLCLHTRLDKKKKEVCLYCSVLHILLTTLSKQSLLNGSVKPTKSIKKTLHVGSPGACSIMMAKQTQTNHNQSNKALSIPWLWSSTSPVKLRLWS